MTKNQSIPGWPEMPSVTGSASQINNAFTSGLAGGMDFIKNFWGNSASGVPGFVVPTIDLKDLEKRIKDLKAVEGWLDVNINMLRTTIQALEVQHSTIATIHALSDSMSNTADAAKNMMDNASSAATAYASGSPEPASDAPSGNRRQRKPKAKPNSGLPPGWPTPSAAPVSPAAKTSVQTTAASVEKPPAKKARPVAKKPTDKAEAAAGNPDATEQAAASAGAWLNFLQDQFSKVATTTMSGSKADIKTPAKKAATKSNAKPATKSAAKSRRR